MFDCFHCKEKVETNDQLLVHIKIAHPMLSIFRCSEYNCQRSFSLYYSFWKHRKNEHNTKTETATLNLQQILVGIHYKIIRIILIHLKCIIL